jgi:hypothetical protein
MNTPTKFGSNWSSGIRENDLKQITTLFETFGLPVSLLYFQSTKKSKKHKLFRGPSIEHSYRVWFQLAQ